MRQSGMEDVGKLSQLNIYSLLESMRSLVSEITISLLNCLLTFASMNPLDIEIDGGSQHLGQ